MRLLWSPVKLLTLCLGSLVGSAWYAGAIMACDLPSPAWPDWSWAGGIGDWTHEVVNLCRGAPLGLEVQRKLAHVRFPRYQLFSSPSSCEPPQASLQKSAIYELINLTPVAAWSGRRMMKACVLDARFQYFHSNKPAPSTTFLKPCNQRLWDDEAPIPVGNAKHRCQFTGASNGYKLMS